MTPATAEQFFTSAKHGRSVAEHLRALALAPVADPTPHDAQAELSEDRAALGQAVDAKSVLRRVDQPQFKILESVDVGAHAWDVSIVEKNGKAFAVRMSDSHHRRNANGLAPHHRASKPIGLSASRLTEAPQ